MATPPSEKRPEKRNSLLRVLDRSAVVALLCTCLLATAAYWYRNQHGWVEIDRAPRGELTFQLDINHADWPEFTLLPDVGESLAKRIVQSREAEGPFADHEDLARVRGIGPKTLARVRPFLMPMPNAQSVADSQSR